MAKKLQSPPPTPAPSPSPPPTPTPTPRIIRSRGDMYSNVVTAKCVHVQLSGIWAGMVTLERMENGSWNDHGGMWIGRNHAQNIDTIVEFANAVDHRLRLDIIGDRITFQYDLTDAQHA